MTFFLNPICENAFYDSMRLGAEAEAKTLGGIKIDYQTSPTQCTPEAQVPILDAALATHPAALLVAPADATAMFAPIEQWKKAGIPVVLVNSTLKDTSPAISSVSTDNVAGGVLGATTLAKLIGDKGTVASLSTTPGMSTLDQRTHGFNLGMKAYPKVRNVGTQYNQDSETLAASQATALITRYPDLAGMFAGNDFSGFGAATAIANAHKTGAVKLVTFDSDPGNIAYLKSGKVQAIIAQDPYAIGVKAVWIADMWITGHRSGIAKHYSTPLAVITKANYQSPAMQNFIYR